MIHEFGTRIPVAVCETQPLMTEGLRAILNSSDAYQLSLEVRTLDEAVNAVIAGTPRILIIDKALGSTAALECISRLRDRVPTALIVWGSSMNESEAVRFLKVGARGILRKTAESGTILACLDAVTNGATWMEDTLFHEAVRLDRRPRTDLTPREQQVLELVEQGLRNKDIARELGIRPGTVKIHLKHIFEKTGVRGRYGLALSGLKDRGLIPMITV
jgi:DNA-binding NarL/FixJ family response regulator